MKCARIILEEFLRKVGCRVARHPCMFTFCPLMLSFLLTTGIQKIKILQDIESLYLPSTGFSIRYRSYLESLFPMNLSSNFYPERYTREGSFGSIIIVANDGESILRPHILKEIFLLDHAVQEMKIYWDNRQWNYKHICARNQKICFQNSIFNFENIIIAKDKCHRNTDLNYWFDTSSFDTGYSSYGEILSSNENKSVQAKALRMVYYLDDSTESRKYLSYQWENTFINKFESIKFSNISIDVLSSKSLENTSWRIFRRTVLYFSIGLCLMAFCWLVIASKPNCFQGKPWMGFVIAISSSLVVSSGHGLLMYCELYFVPTTMTAGIAIVGITTVDTLAMVSIWRRTDSKKSVEDRLGETYSEIGVPIITSFLINFLSLLIGTTFSPFQEFSIFCFYMSSCLALGFLYQMTLIGGFVAAFGYAEKKNLHPLTFRPMQITSAKGNQFSFCSHNGWQESNNNLDNRTRSSVSPRNIVIGAMRKVIAHAQSKPFLILLYSVYFATSIWGITNIKNDYTFKEATSQDTDVNSYFYTLRENFNEYQDKIQVVLNTTLNYADPNVQTKINVMLNTFKSGEYGDFRAKSWLRDYLKYLSNKRVSLVLKSYNITDKDDFLYVLRHHFFRYPLGREFVNDIVFDEGNNDIIASRFLLRSYSPMREKDYWKRLQKFIHISNEKFFPTIVFHPKLFIYEGTELSLPITLMELGTKAVIIAIVCSIILSSIISAVIICSSYISVCAGVLGYMALWGVGMNPISSKYIVCFSSLSINYLTHSACAHTSNSKRTENNLCWTIKLVILKGGVVSILSVVTVFIRPSWTLSSAFKSGFLTTVLAALQAICFQTIVFSLYDSFNEKVVKWTTASCSRKRDCRIRGTFRHPTVGGIYNGTVVISHIDLCT